MVCISGPAETEINRLSSIKMNSGTDGILSPGFAQMPLPRVDGRKSSENGRQSNMSHDSIDESSLAGQRQSSPEDICTVISPFRPNHRSWKISQSYDKDHSSAKTWELPRDIKTDQSLSKYDRNKPKFPERQKTTFMQLVLAESSPEPSENSPREAKKNRKNSWVRKSSPHSKTIDSRRFSPVHSVKTHRNIVPRLNLPSDIVPDREKTLVGISRSGYQATPTTPDRSYRGNADEEVFGRKPVDIDDPLDEIIGNQPVSERKYTILPSIGTPGMNRRNKGSNSSRNQLDYGREHFESNAGFFAEQSSNLSVPVVTPRDTQPLPPILKSSNAWSSPSPRGRKGDEDKEMESESRNQTPEVPISERRITDISLSFAK